MRTTRLGWLGAVLCCLSVTLSAQPSNVVQDPKAADFGTSNLTHVRVTAMEFVPLQSGLAGDWKSAGGFTRYPSDNASLWAAPLHLPGGSVVRRLELDYCDNNPAGHLYLTLRECDNEGLICTNVVEVDSTNNGCNFVSDDTLSLRIDNFHKIYGLSLAFGAADGSVVLGGAIVSYQLEVSPAPVTPSFADVPKTDAAYQFIEAVYASGITAGCGGGKFCPDAPLTRRQMAVFLAKALGLQWTNF